MSAKTDPCGLSLYAALRLCASSHASKSDAVKAVKAKAARKDQKDGGE